MSTVQSELQRGWKLHQQKELAEAERIYRNVVQQAASSSHAWCYLGMVLHDQQRYHDAVSAYEESLRLEPEFPIALNNLGNSLRYVDQYERADASFQKAIDLKPDYLNAYKNRGTLHVWTGHLDKGLHYYEKALELNPSEPELHRNLGVIYLLQGRFEEGWAEYRWRWKVGDLHRPSQSIPVWQGEQLNGKSILLTAEQGLGDTMHFARFAFSLQSLGASTMIYCQPPLVALLQASGLGAVYPNSLGIDRVFDYQCSLLDVADILNINVETIPSYNAYLSASPQLVGYWQSQSISADEKLKVGINWQGNPDHQADVYRSVPLEQFRPLADLPDVELISLQQGRGTEQLAHWNGSSAITTLPADIDQSGGAFMDTAAIVSQLDLVITSDTAVAHLAAAVGVPTWIALGYIPDWRWLLKREDSPWYPSVRLFRQSRMGDWTSVFAELRESLAEFAAARRST